METKKLHLRISSFQAQHSHLQMSLFAETRVTSCCQFGVKLASSWPVNSPDNIPIKLSQNQMQKLQLWLHVQAQENRSQGVEERYTILHSITQWKHAEALNSKS